MTHHHTATSLMGLYCHFSCGCGQPRASKDDSTVTAPEGRTAAASPRRRHAPQSSGPWPPSHVATQHARLSFESSSEEEGSMSSTSPLDAPSTSSPPPHMGSPAAVGVPLYRTTRKAVAPGSLRRPVSPQQAPLEPVRELPGWEAVHDGNTTAQPRSTIQRAASTSTAAAAPSPFEKSPPTPPPTTSDSPPTPPGTPTYRTMSDPLPEGDLVQQRHTPRTPRTLPRAASYNALPAPEPLGQRWDLTFASSAREKRFLVWHNEHRATFWDAAGAAVLLAAGALAKSVQYMGARPLAPVSSELVRALVAYVLGGTLVLVPMVALTNGTLLSHRRYITRWREPILASARLLLMCGALAHRLGHPGLYLARGMVAQSLPATCAASMALLSSLLWPVRWFLHLQLQTLVTVLAVVHVAAVYTGPAVPHVAPWWMVMATVLLLGHALPTGLRWWEEREQRRSFVPAAV